MRYKQVWKGSQSLEGWAVDSDHNPPLRSRVKRDAYDSQSYGVTEAWTHVGWSVVMWYPIERLVSVDASAYVPEDRREESFDLVRRDLEALLAEGRRFFEGTRGGE